MDAAEAAGERRVARRRRLTTILSADLCGYTGLSERDPDGALAAVEALTARIVRVAEAHGGRLFHRAGDGFLVELPSATEGLGAARDLHRTLADAPIRAAGAPVQVRIGVHTGEAAEEADGDLLGHAVNVAARLQGEAARGGTVISGATRQLALTGVPMRRMGDLRLKNLREPVRAYEVLADPGLFSRLRARLRTRWLRRNAPALAVVGALVAVCAVVVAASMVSRDRAMRAERAAEARAAALAEDAARLSDLLTDDEGRLLAREAVEEAALSLLSSDDPRKAEAKRLALGGDTLGAARALRATYDVQARDGAGPEALAETAVQAGALAYAQDKVLAQWAYERAYAVLPREPFVLMRLAAIGRSRNEDEDARSYLTALIATEPEPRYVIEAEGQLAQLALERYRFEEAETRLRRALALARATDRTSDEANTLRQLGGLASFRLARSGLESADAAELRREARGNLERSLRVYRALRDVEGVAGVLGQLGGLAQLVGDYPEAVDRFGQYLALATDANDQAAIASASFNLAETYDAMGELEPRDRAWRNAAEAAERAGLDSLLAPLHIAKAKYAFEEGNEDAACSSVLDASAYHRPDDPGIGHMRENMLAGLDCGGAISAEMSGTP